MLEVLDVRVDRVVVALTGHVALGAVQQVAGLAAGAGLVHQRRRHGELEAALDLPVDVDRGVAVAPGVRGVGDPQTPLAGLPHADEREDHDHDETGRENDRLALDHGLFAP